MPLRRLAVLQRGGKREEAAEAYAAVVASLQQSGAYQVVELEQLERFAPAQLLMSDGSVNMPVAMEAARRMHLDGLLTLEIRFVEPDGSMYGTKTFRIGDPVIAAGIRYELIDAWRGTVMDRNLVKSDFYRGELSSGRVSPTSETRVLSDLARQSGLKLANLLAPHQEEVEVKLAHASLGLGTSKLRQGVKAARQGDWQQARQLWNEAVQEDADNDAALYNLGVACEATGDHVAARQAYEAALRINDSSDYRAALDRVHLAESDMRLAQFQISGRR